MRRVFSTSLGRHKKAELSQDAGGGRLKGLSFGFVAPATLIVAALMLGPAGAQAIIVHTQGNTISYEPPPSSVKAGSRTSGASPAKKPPASVLEYHGGPVMPSNTNYALYWDPSGPPQYPAGYQTGINRYFEDLAHDSGGILNTDSVLAQYGDVSGEFANYNSHFGGALIDTNPYPANGCSAAPICLTDAQLRAEITKYVETHALATDLRHEYFMLTPPGVESCLEAASKACSNGTAQAAYCAYHGYIKVPSGVIIYANDPYVDGLNCDFGEEHPNGSPADATIGGGLAHEHSESVTDPELNAWFDSKGREVGDKCRTFKEKTEFGEPLGTAPNGSKYNQIINGDLYWYQQEWSNNAGGCQQRSGQLPTVTKVAPKSGPASGGTSVTITGTGFAAPATVKFDGTPAANVTVKSSTSITATSPAGSVGIVDVTVTTSVGTSAIGKKDHFKYKPH